MPPLRERGDDVLLLAGHFLEVNRARLGLRSLRLDAAAEAALLRYSWPGNVRELEHVVGRAALKLLSRGVNRRDIVTLTVDLLDLVEAAGEVVGEVVGERPGVLSSATVSPQASEASHVPQAPGLGLRMQVEQLERRLVHEALQVSGGRWAEAARRLGIDASNLHKLAKRLGVK